MKKEAVAPEVIDQCILELSGEFGLGGVLGRHVKAIYAVMQDRGFERDDVTASLETVLKKGFIEVRYGNVRAPLSDPDALLSITTDGKDHLRQLRAMMQFNIRIPENLLGELGSVSREGESPGFTAVRALHEWVRMERFPGIRFRWTASGRKPFVAGTGMSAWEIFHVWRDFGKNADHVAKAYPYLKLDKINVAVAYAEAYIREMPVGEWGEKPPFAREVRV